MGHSVTLGGERVGSGNKNKVYLHNYERSTHDLSTDFESTMGCGMLIPFMCELVTRDDKYEIDLSAGLRTIPTKGPLFGSFKLQLDVYQCPLRLYQALLHNNPLAIGLKASQVKFPKIRLYGKVPSDPTTRTTIMASNNSLVKYLGISGIGTAKGNSDEFAYRDMFGSGVLAYYDIFKNYYANKQEENAYTLNSYLNQIRNDMPKMNMIAVYKFANSSYNDAYLNQNEYTIGESGRSFSLAEATDDNVYYQMYLRFEEPNKHEITEEQLLNTSFYYGYGSDGTTTPVSTNTTNVQTALSQGIIKEYEIRNGEQGKGAGGWNIRIMIRNMFNAGEVEGEITWNYLKFAELGAYYYTKEEEVILRSFPLENIDKMRYDILSFHQLGQSYLLDGDNDLMSPYYHALGSAGDEIDGKLLWQSPLAGICVKTYQSDLFNNWLNTEVIDGENGIAAITAIDTTEGSITIDALQFSEKLYNLLNRIAVSGGTYEDYLDAAYTESHKRFNESPIWIGGMSDEIVFEEILQTAPTEGQPLGTIGGRGNLTGRKKGGKITVKIDEPSLLIGIISITPRIVYTQGNMWFNTEIDNLADIHVPALDAIGFQNLIGEQLHAGSTIINSDGTLEERPIIGKVPAWINYMTNFDRAYGDFAAPDGDGFMVLQRQYELTDGIIQDATTYIDPAKYNYAFAYTKRDAQNFWVKIKCDIKARRLMSAKQIPTA